MKDSDYVEIKLNRFEWVGKGCICVGEGQGTKTLDDAGSAVVCFRGVV